MDLKAILDFGCFGVLAWVVWFVFSKALPTFILALKEQRQEFLVALDKQQIKFDVALEKERVLVASQTIVIDKLHNVVIEHDKVMREAHSHELDTMIRGAIEQQFSKHNNKEHIVL